jgi:cysteinyl-tRNA synthetase
MADWEGGQPAELSPEGKELDRRFRSAVADDLDTPTALKALNEAVSASIPDADKVTLLTSWDAVLGLDLGRLAREGFAVPEDVRHLVGERDEARGAKDFARSDEIRDRLAQMGWEVMDSPDGTRVRPLHR